MVSGKHSIFAPHPEGLKLQVVKRTKITRVPCRKRTGHAVLRAHNFGDLRTTDHKVLSERCESRDNHRYAIVVQDLAKNYIHQRLTVPRQNRIADRAVGGRIPWNVAFICEIFKTSCQMENTL